jgi:hypothetical protein
MEPEGSLPWARWIQYKISNYISLRTSLILFSHLYLGLPSDLFPSGFPIKVCMTFSSLLRLLNTHSSGPPWFDHPNNIWWIVQVMKLLIMQSCPASRHFLPLWSKVLLSTCSETQSMFSPCCERPSFTPIQNKMWNYILYQSDWNN